MGCGLGKMSGLRHFALLGAPPVAPLPLSRDAPRDLRSHRGLRRGGALPVAAQAPPLGYRPKAAVSSRPAMTLLITLRTNNSSNKFFWLYFLPKKLSTIEGGGNNWGILN